MLACCIESTNAFSSSAGDLLLDKKRSITNLCTLRLRSLKPKDFLHGGDAYEHGQQLCTGLGPWGSCRPARGGPPGWGSVIPVALLVPWLLPGVASCGCVFCSVGNCPLTAGWRWPESLQKCWLPALVRRDLGGCWSCQGTGQEGGSPAGASTQKGLLSPEWKTLPCVSLLMFGMGNSLWHCFEF